MKVKLQSSEVFFEVGELDTSSGDFRVRKKETPSEATDGIYDFVGKDLLAIFFADNDVHVRIGDFSIAATENVSARIYLKKEVNNLVISNNGNVIFSYKYRPKAPDPLDPTPFVGKEDCDFCLFISNIINSPERKALFRPEN